MMDTAFQRGQRLADAPAIYRRLEGASNSRAVAADATCIRVGRNDRVVERLERVDHAAPERRRVERCAAGEVILEKEDAVADFSDDELEDLVGVDAVVGEPLLRA